jgi:hypothetical protein
MSPEPEAEREPEPEPKRVRRESRVDDKARGKRLFGNLLGTLQKFKTEDKTSRTSEAAKRREEVAGRIAAKIRSENNLHHEIAESERELKTLRIQTDSAEYVLKHKDAAVSVFILNSLVLVARLRVRWRRDMRRCDQHPGSCIPPCPSNGRIRSTRAICSILPPYRSTTDHPRNHLPLESPSRSTT